MQPKSCLQEKETERENLSPTPPIREKGLEKEASPLRVRAGEERKLLPPVIDVGTPPSLELLLAYAHVRLHYYDDAFTREWHRVMTDKLCWRHPKTGRPIVHWPDYFRQWRANRAFFEVRRDPNRLMSLSDRKAAEAERLNEAQSARLAKLRESAVAALTERDWELCAESCANCSGRSCSKGNSLPCDHRLSPRPVPPSECPHFSAKGGAA